MKLKHWIFIIIGLHIVVFAVVSSIQQINVNPSLEIGQEIDQLNGVQVYYNGGVDTVTGRNTTPDGYNLGLKYQCVEFVKRY